MKESKMTSKDRNYNIDFLRGIATLWIVIIHTAFWSGESYLPATFKNLILFIDVPVFIFISGISFNYVNSIIKNLKGILLQWKKWIYFVFFYAIILFVFYRESTHFSEIFNWLVYSFPSTTSLPVVQGSIWFITMYIKVSILCSIIICAVRYFIPKDEEKSLKVLIFILLLLFLNTTLSKTNLIFSSYTSFYSIIYLLGYILNNYKIKNAKQFLAYETIALISTIIIFLILGLNISNIQDVKFPPSMPYLFVSSFSIILFWYLKDKLQIKKQNKINYIGKNAIFFYFSQGISSSLIYLIMPYINLNIYLKFAILLIINITIAIVIAVLLSESFKYLSKLLKNVKIKKVFSPLKINKKEL